MEKTLYLNKCKLRRKFKRNWRTVNNSMDNFEDKNENNVSLEIRQLKHKYLTPLNIPGPKEENKRIVFLSDPKMV